MSQVTRRAMMTGMAAAAIGSGLEQGLDGRGQQAPAPQRRILVFDVNETLLDVGALAPQFERLFGNAAVVQEWFTNVVLYSQTLTLAGDYLEFGQIARAAFEMTARAHGIVPSAADADASLRGLLSLPAHPDVKPALEQLKAAGFRLVTLTNSAPAGVEQQLSGAGIRDYFERAFSVGAVRKFKPAPEVYGVVTKELAVPAAQLRLIAAHPWDVLGAMKAGYAGAFVERPGKSWFPSVPAPDIVGRNLGDVAAALIRSNG